MSLPVFNSGRLGGLMFLLALLALATLSLPSAAQAQTALYTIDDSIEEPPLEKASGVLALSDELVHWGLRIDPSVIARGADQIDLELPNGEVVTAFRDHFEQRENGAFWRGRLPKSGFSGSAVQLTLHDGFVVGNMHTHAGRYRIAPTPSGNHRLLQLEANEAACAAHAPPALGSRERAAAAPAFGPAAEAGDLRVEQHAGATIDVMAYYTETAASRWGGDAQAKASVQGAIDYQNTVFSNSQIDARTRLVFSGPAPSLNVNDGDGLLPEFRTHPEVVAKRNSLKADLAHLFVGQPASSLGYCGIAYLLTRGDNAAAFSPFGYGITTNGRGCSSYEEVFSHEQGHNMGANHDPQNASINPNRAVANYALRT